MSICDFRFAICDSVADGSDSGRSHDRRQHTAVGVELQPQIASRKPKIKNP